ncbi:SCO3242 family prenyltransferase [Streptomyces chryseus]|uniref:SCO3242 family prenyltransferase n=1 Tax=Streptomyces chryseus TaxID=68186 RepID=UPI00110FA5DB|nr:UbiA family prenyltransferase [Streptomyces chryseus]
MRPAARAAAWAQLLRVSALFTVPGDAVAGAASVGVRPNRGTALAAGASLCLYEAGMALNDWADRAEDAVDRPHRPIPSGRVTPRAALAASGALTAAGLALAAGAGRPALAVASGLAATIWAYDLRLKHTPAAPATMAAARALDLLLGATATATRGRSDTLPARLAASRGFRPPVGPAAAGAGAHDAAGHARRRDPARPASVERGPERILGAPGGGARNEGRRTRPTPGRDALTAATVLGTHTYAVTAVSRRETQGGSTTAPLAALAATAVLATLTARTRPGDAGAVAPPRGAGGAPAPATRQPRARHRAHGVATHLATPAGLAAAAYFRTAAKPFLHAVLNPSPALTQRAVGGGIRAMIPLQAALAARSGAAGTGAALLGLVPVARKLSRKVSPT